MANPLNNKELSAQIQDGLAPLNRRAFLKAGLGVAVAASSVLTLGCSSEVPVDPALKALSASQQALFQRMTHILLPTKGTSLASVDSVPVLANINQLFSGLDAKVLGDLEGATMLFEHGSLLLGGHFSRFTRLDDAGALAYIESWQNGNSLQRGIVDRKSTRLNSSH